MMRIDIVSDAICPWCFIGKRHLAGALALLSAEGLEFETRWLPFQLNPEMPVEGVARAAYRAAKFGSLERSQELDEGVTQAGRAAGLDFRFDLMSRTPNTVLAHRLIWLAEAAGLQDAIVERLFQGYFQQGLDIGRRETLDAVAREIGVDSTPLGGDAAQSEVLAADAGYRSAGLTGVPSFLMQGHLVLSGAMPAEQMAARLRHAHAVLQARAAVPRAHVAE